VPPALPVPSVPPEEYLFACPHCEMLIQVPRDGLNCQIFRHGSYKINNEQIPPHLPRDECNRLIGADLIYGCGKPFTYNGIVAAICDYI
jgi:hypothetical protein